MSELTPELKELAEAEQEFREAHVLETNATLRKQKARYRLLRAREEHRAQMNELLGERI